MTASKTILYFAYYLGAVGATLLIAPNMFLSTLSLPETDEPWIRVAGVLTLVLGSYYHQMGQAGITAFAKATIRGRVSVFLVFTLFAIFHWFPPIIIGVGAIDLAGAAWTWYALRAEKK